MSSITLKDIPTALHRALKEQARRHGRSLNKEILACLEAVMLPQKRDVKELLADIRKHRTQLPGRLTDDLIAQ